MRGVITDLPIGTYLLPGSYDDDDNDDNDGILTSRSRDTMNGRSIL